MLIFSYLSPRESREPKAIHNSVLKYLRNRIEGFISLLNYYDF